MGYTGGGELLMAMGSTSRAARDLRSLYVLGRVGALSDSRLIEIFLRSEGSEREEAFSALVQRHAPMVLGTCRRVLRGSPDADDAFQAVFLVLARKAGSLRRAEGLKPWLYGVAVRTAKEARRRSARLRAREGALMDASAIATESDNDRGDLLALLDEEIERLPARYREPLMLCELEGLSRRDAAARLNLPEGTISSRLARGRSLLRDRLTRRGVTLGTGAIAALVADAASASPSITLMDSTSRIAITFAAGGTVAPGVASLAEGALRMILASKLRMALVAVLLGGMASLTTGFAIAATGREAPRVEPVAEVIAIPVEPQPDTDKPMTRGVVVDEVGHPLVGADVRLNPFTFEETRGLTGKDGSFAITIGQLGVRGRSILARSADGVRVGYIKHEFDLTNAEAAKPARIVVKPAKVVVVNVKDANGKPAQGTVVQAAGDYTALAEATTGDDGSARLFVPVDASINWIVAVKKGGGFDYAEFGKLDGPVRGHGSIPAADLPGAVDLSLSPARTVKVKALDLNDKPLVGVALYVWVLGKEGKKSYVEYTSRIFFETTDAAGFASFDWLPPEQRLLTFYPGTKGYAHRSILVELDQTGIVTARLSRTETLKGSVRLPDGSAAGDIMVAAFGTGQGQDEGLGRTRTLSDGSYVMDLPPNEAYAVGVDDKEWAARSRLDVVIRPGQPVDGIDFKLFKGTVIRGQLTVGPPKLPLAKQYIRLDQDGGSPPKDIQPDPNRTRNVHRSVNAPTDDQGRYAIRVGPGTYRLYGPPMTEPQTITVTDQAGIVHDFNVPRPEKGTLTGVVAGPDGKPIAGATVEIHPQTMTTSPFTVTCDDQGRFATERPTDRLSLYARNPDRSLAEVGEVGIDQDEITIALAPSATVSGVLVDPDGKILARQRLSCGSRVFRDGERSVFGHDLSPSITTDEKGRFTIPGMVVGLEYQLMIYKVDSYIFIGSVKPEKPGVVDMGNVKAKGR